jgi:hypothetical protein
MHDAAALQAGLIRRHLMLGWWGLLIFLTLGIVLELLHSFKVAGYLAPASSTRRLLWTLAHSHGTLFSVLHLAFAATIALAGLASGVDGERASRLEAARTIWAGRFLTTAWVVMPLGFLAGGFGLQGGDPGWGIFLAPAGAACLLISAGLTIAAIRQESATPTSRP